MIFNVYFCIQPFKIQLSISIDVVCVQRTYIWSKWTENIWKMWTICIEIDWQFYWRLKYIYINLFLSCMHIIICIYFQIRGGFKCYSWATAIEHYKNFFSFFSLLHCTLTRALSLSMSQVFFKLANCRTEINKILRASESERNFT